MSEGKIKIGTIILLIGMSLLGLLFLFPFFWMFVTALKRPDELCFDIVFFPAKPQWQHYHEVLFTNDVVAFWSGFQNTLIICAVVTTVCCLSSAMVGYGFARFRAPGRNILFTIMLATMMLPQIVTVIPHYVIYLKLGLLSLPWPFCYIPWLINSLPGSAIFIFYYRQFFIGLPKELEDAALIDGCGRIRTFWRIFMPLAGPAVTTVCIFLFQWTYNDYVGPLLYLKQADQTLAVLMINHTKLPGVKFQLPIPPVPYQMTVAILFTIPLIILFFFAQRHFMQGMATTGLKG